MRAESGFEADVRIIAALTAKPSGDRGKFREVWITAERVPVPGAET